jgi:methionine-rich copper-binding protein CopC
MVAARTAINRRLLVVLTLASAQAWVPLAGAHASLVRAIPDAGSSVHESPAKLKLWFSGPLEPAFSTVEVLDGTEKRVDNGDPEVDGADRKLLHVSVPQLQAGTYRVIWRVLSVDRHVSKGDFTFDIAP